MYSGHEAAFDQRTTSTDGSQFVEDVDSLYLSEKSSDVTFIVDSVKFHGHKLILAVRNKRFEALLNQNAEEKEITISQTSPEAFKFLLKFIYTGIINMPSSTDVILQVLTLAHRFSCKQLTLGMIKNITTILDTKNVFFFLNGSNDNLDELRDACLLFMDANALKILSSDSFNDLTQTSVVQVLKRDTFLAPEIAIFKSVAKWCEKNQQNLVLQCVRLSVLTVPEIVSIVWPTKLVDDAILLQTISEIVGTSSKKIRTRAILAVDENVATVQNVAEVIPEENTIKLLTDNTNLDQNVKHTIDGEHGIIICLRQPFCINHIRMRLYDADDRYYSYYIESSLDRKKWQKIVDYSKYACRFVQNLYFEEHVSQYIKIVGTKNTKGTEFHLVFFEAFYKSNIPKTINAVICPEKNVATLDNKTVVLQGSDANLLNGNYASYSSHTMSGSNCLMLQLAQPYLISSMRLLLYSTYKYNYYIETSVNKTEWEIAVDRREQECESWQDVCFQERVVVFIKITGTSYKEYIQQYGQQYGQQHGQQFYCSYFECPSEGKTTNNDGEPNV